ncbi:MAG: class I SAM-dependent methyltransferase [Treponema sp.]|jgi:SAM-dependent methyltransferase|nr:class I SAM-dependent methyltransferase [Treponema sp.]
MKRPPVKTWSTPVTLSDSKPIPCALCGADTFKPRLFCEGFFYVRCRQCGLVQMNPQPPGAEVHIRYSESRNSGGHGDEYLSYELKNEEAFLRLQELALQDAGFEALEKELLNKTADRPRILDVGCATGALLEKLRKKGWDTTGVEISPSAEYARSKKGLDVRSLPLEENHFPSESFDVVLASHLIEHLNDPGAFVRESHRILKEGGSLFVTTPNIAGFQAKLFKGRWRSAIFDHLYLFSVKTLSALLTDCGFSIEKVATWGGLAAGIGPAPVKRLVDKAAKRFGSGDVMMIRGRKRER